MTSTVHLEALLRRGSSGPWTVDPADPLQVVQDDSLTTPIAAMLGAQVERQIMQADAELIALAPSLAAEVIQLRQENETLRQRLQNLWEANNAARAALYQQRSNT